MNGMFASFGRDGGVTSETLDRGIESLAHRGPDGKSLWLSPKGRFGLAHRYLRVNATSNSGEHSAASADGNYRLALTGRVYGVDRAGQSRLQREISGSTAGAELLLKLLIDHGPRCLEYIRGEFAFVFWN